MKKLLAALFLLAFAFNLSALSTVTFDRLVNRITYDAAARFFQLTSTTIGFRPSMASAATGWTASGTKDIRFTSMYFR